MKKEVIWDRYNANVIESNAKNLVGIVTIKPQSSIKPQSLIKSQSSIKSQSIKPTQKNDEGE